MALSSTAIVSLERARAHLRLSPLSPNFQVAAFVIYHNQTASPATATVAVNGVNLILDSADAGQDQTISLTAGATDTIAELIAAIVPANGWIAQQVTFGDALSVDLVPIAATNILGITNRVALSITATRDLELVIEGVTDEIERWLDRHVVIRDFDELHTLDRVPIETLTLREPDLTEVERVSIDSQASLRVRYNGADQHATVEVTDAAVILRSRAGTLTETPLTFAANTTVGALVTAIGGVAGWTATTQQDGPSVYLVRQGAQDASGVDLTLYSWMDLGDFYAVDYSAGAIIFEGAVWPYAMRDWWLPGRHIMVEYAAGLSATTAAVPDDIQAVALGMISTAWNQRGIASNDVQSRSLGDYSETLRSVTEIAETGTDWRDRLNGYKRMGV